MKSIKTNLRHTTRHLQCPQKLRGDNFNLASGNVEDGGKKYLLKSTSTYRTVEELRNLPLSTNIILSDIAVLKYELRKSVTSLG